MKRIFFLLTFIFFGAQLCFAGHSIIVEMEGTANMEEAKSEQETCRTALLNAKRNATEHAISYIKSETVVKDFQTEKDLVEAYALAKVVILGDILEKEWFNDPVMGKSCRVKARLEVTPVADREGAGGAGNTGLNDPAGPLLVKAWTDKDLYHKGERVKVYVQGNKPYYVKLVYRDAQNNLLQLLPNPYREDNYFNGGTIYEIPSGSDQFELEVTPPYGAEKIMVYASTSPLGNINLINAQTVYQVDESEKSMGLKTRGIKITRKADKPADKPNKAAEFFETSIDIKIKK